MANALKARLPKGAEPKGIGELLREIHDDSDFTVLSLAEEAGLSPSYLNKIRAGKATPSIPMVEKILDVLGFDLTLIYVPRGKDGND